MRQRPKHCWAVVDKETGMIVLTKKGSANNPPRGYDPDKYDIEEIDESVDCNTHYRDEVVKERPEMPVKVDEMPDGSIKVTGLPQGAEVCCHDGRRVCEKDHDEHHIARPVGQERLHIHCWPYKSFYMSVGRRLNNADKKAKLSAIKDSALRDYLESFT